jgi:CheY-like chemotaxis protein
MRILIVDDDRDTRDSVSEVLLAEGFSPSQAENGSDALRFLARTPVAPDVVVLDAKMPVMDGESFLRALRALKDERSTIPVVIVTGLASTPEGRIGDTPIEVADRESKVRRGSVRADAVVYKPLDGARVLEAIARVLSRRALQ